jgi:hypothetical protein
MAWYSYTLALPVDLNTVKTVDDAAVLTGLYSADSPFVHTSSRNGAMLGLLSQIYTLYLPQASFYLLQDFAKLEGPALEKAKQAITELLARIQQNPALVSEATKTPYTPYLTLQTDGFEPLEAELVYPPEALIREGFFYEYPPEKVIQALHKAEVSSHPDLPHDPDGESLEYLFCLLKSHLWLLQAIDPSTHVLCYGELNT